MSVQFNTPVEKCEMFAVTVRDPQFQEHFVGARDMCLDALRSPAARRSNPSGCHN
jgi:hypothetical protein